MEETVPIIRAQAKIDIRGLIVSLNREERGQGDKGALDEIKDKYGFQTKAIVNMSEVVDYLYDKPYHGKVYIDDEMKSRLDDYYRQYGAAVGI